jgi:hypothetical protein
LSFQKINDLSNSPIKSRFNRTEFSAETNLCVAMGRVSLKKNKDKGNSDEAQLERIEEYIKKTDLVLASEPWDVAETASKHEKRKHFIEMLQLVKDSQLSSKPIKHIVFSHQSRSNRNRESARELENLIRNNDVTLHCVRDGLVLTRFSPFEDWLRWDLFNGLNEKYIVDHTKNVWDGTIKRLEMGLFPCLAPFGYKNRREETLGNLSIFILKHPESDWMFGAFELAATGHFSSIEIKHMMDRKYPEVKKSPDEGRLGELLRSPFYMGEFDYMGQRWKGHPEYHPKLVSFGMWKKVQDELTQRSRPKVTEHRHPYIGLMRCGGFLLDENGKETDQECGGSVTAEEKRKVLKNGSINLHYYYHCCSRPQRRCSQRSREFMKINFGRIPIYKEDELETMFQEIVKGVSFSREQVGWMKELLMKHHREISGGERMQRDALKSRYEMLFRYQDKAYEDKLGGVINDKMFREKNEKWQSEITAIENELRSSRDEHNERMENGIALIELLEGADTTWKNAAKETKARILKILVSNLTLKSGSIQYDYRKPFDLLSKSDSHEIWWKLPIPTVIQWLPP